MQDSGGFIWVLPENDQLRFAVARKGIDSPEPFTARYIMIGITAFNRGKSHNLMEIYPYIVIPDGGGA